jgi:peptidoglycan/LPS O-acetylase OafA/YrhL
VIGVLTSLTYTANWAAATHHELGWFWHMWSLSVEEQFYFLWPLAFAFMTRFGVRVTRNVAVVVLVAAATNMFIRSLLGQSFEVLYYSTDTHGAMSLMAGCVLALTLPPDLVLDAARRHLLGMLTALATFFLMVAVALIGPRRSFYYRGGYVLVLVSVVVLVLAALHLRSVQALLRLPLLVTVGRLSYGIYLWHVATLQVILREVHIEGMSRSGYRLMALLGTAAIALVSYNVVEQPIRRAVASRLSRPPLAVGVNAGQ